MRDNLTEYVISCLNAYPSMIRAAAVLRFELLETAAASEDEIIETMAYSKSIETFGATGPHFDRTAYAALNYRQEVMKLEQESRRKGSEDLCQISREIARLEFYIGLLDKKEATVLRMYYFEKLTWAAIAKAIDASDRTARTIRDQAVKKLSECYALSQRFTTV